MDRKTFDKNISIGLLAASLALAVFALSFVIAILYIG